MEQWTRIQLKKGLKELIPEIDYLKNSEDFDGKNGGILALFDELRPM